VLTIIRERSHAEASRLRGAESVIGQYGKFEYDALVDANEDAELKYGR